MLANRIESESFVEALELLRDSSPPYVEDISALTKDDGDHPIFSPEFLPGDNEEMLRTLKDAGVDVYGFARLVHDLYERAGRPTMESQYSGNSYFQKWRNLRSYGFDLAVTALRLEEVEGNGKRLSEIPGAIVKFEGMTPEQQALPFYQRHALQDNVAALVIMSPKYSSLEYGPLRVKAKRSIEMRKKKEEEPALESDREYLKAKLDIERDFINAVVNQGEL